MRDSRYYKCGSIDYPALYDEEYRIFRHDLPFWQYVVDKYAGDKVLELGCGTGRVTIPLVESGYSVDCVDIDRLMLNHLKNKVRDKGIADRISIIHESIMKIDLRRKYYCIIAAFNVIAMLRANIELQLCLIRVKKHLKRGGHFVFDVPKVEEYYFKKRPLSDCHHFKFDGNMIIRRDSYQISQGEGIFEMYSDYFIRRKGRQLSEKVMKWSSVYALLTPQHIELMAEKFGFQICNIWGDYDRQSISKESPRMIFDLYYA